MAEHSNEIGGALCQTQITAELISCDPATLSREQVDKLWQIFEQIGEHWKDVYNESKNLKSAWLEMIKTKTNKPPSYYAEYINAIAIVGELIKCHGEKQAFQSLFFDYKIPHTSPTNNEEKPQAILTTQLAHAKYYVVDEFIRMQVLSGGFKHFGGQSNTTGELIKVKGVNYKGFVKGSRYRNENLVRTFKPTDHE